MQAFPGKVPSAVDKIRGPCVVSLGADFDLSRARSALLGFIGDGLPRVAYQDATEHALLLARKDAQGQWSLLTVAGLEEPYKGSYGFYNGHVIVGGQSVMATFRYNRTSNPASNGVDLFRF